jgi:MSHA pilin protein MshA
MKWLRNSRGFTLIEMVLIIVILGVLAAVAIPRFVALQNDATAANNVAYVGALRTAVGMRFGEELVRGQDGTNTAADPDVIGSTAVEAPATAANLQARVTTTIPSSLVTTAGACGTGLWTGLQPSVGGAAPASGTWTLTCGTTASDPISISGP